MAKIAIIFNTSQNKNTYRYEIDQLKVVDWNDVLGCCLWNSKLKDQDMSFYVGMPAYEVYEDIKKYAEKELWSDVWKIGKPFSAKVVKASTIEEYAECAIKSYMHTLNYNNLCCVIANGKAKDIMQRISNLINDKDNFDSGYNIRRICMFGNNDKTIRYTDSREKLTFIPCNDSYAYYNMEDYYDKLGFEVWDDYKLYEGKKENKTMKKNRMTERFDAPKDWDFEDMLDDYGMEYLQENDSDNEPIDMDSFDEFLDSPWEAVRSAFYGGRFGFDRDSFNPTDPYFRFNGYGNVESIPYLDDYLKDMIDEESFYDWCVEQGYFESDEDNE